MRKPSRNAPSSRRVLWAATGGVFCALLVASLSGALFLDERDSTATTLGAVAFATLFVTPFLVVLASFLLQDTEQQRSVWLAGAVLALVLAGFTIFSGIGLLFLFVAGVLGWAWWDARSSGAPTRNWLSWLLTLWIVLSLGGSLWLLWWRETPMCWATTGNESAWSSTGSANPGPCTSDIFDTTEGALALERRSSNQAASARTGAAGWGSGKWVTTCRLWITAQRRRSNRFLRTPT